jgi:hypothetical protein
MRHLLIAVLLVGCGDNELVLEGPHYQYVMSSLKLPMNNDDARAFGLDLNSDKTVDNQLGMVFGTLSTMGLGVDGTAREALLRGGLILLADLQTVDFQDSEISGVTTYLGRDPSPTPCLDPARLETCGQQLLGGGHFSIEPDSGSDLGQGAIARGVLSAGVDVLPIELALDVNAPLRLDLHAARVRFTSLSEDGFVGVLGGAIIQDDADRVIVPQAAHEIERIVGAECGQPAGVAPCGCIKASRADEFQRTFDNNDDCEVALDEVANNDLVKALLAPDIKKTGLLGLSFGVGVEFRRATFE